MPMPEDMPESLMKVFGAFMEIGWLMPLVAVVEIIAGILVIPGRFRALGAIMMFPIMVGIVLTHLVNIPTGLPIALILFAINIWMIIDNWEKYLPMIRKKEKTNE